MANLNHSEDKDLLVALQHPLRRTILRKIRSEEVASPRRLSALLEQPLSKVSYHVRVLADCAAIALVDMRPARGSMEHFYRSAVEAPWALEVLNMDKDAGPAGESSTDSDT